MGTARVAQLGVAAALLLSLLAARAAPLPVASSVPSSSSPSSSSSTSSEPCISADLHKVIHGNMGLLQFNADRVLRAFKGMADVEISEHVAILSAAEPCVRRAEAVPSPSHLSGAFALYGALIATLCERAHLPDGSKVRVICRAVVALLEDTPFLPPRSGEEQGDVEAAAAAAAAEVTTAVGRKEGEQQQQQHQTEKKTVKAQSGGGSANDSVVVATEAPGVGNRTETAAAWVAGTSAASTAPTLNHLRGEQYTEAGIADVRNVTATSEEEQWRRTNHHQQQQQHQQQQHQQQQHQQQQRRRPQADDKHSEVEKHRKEEVEKEEADERSQSRWPCLPSHVKHATSLHGSSDSRIVMFALFQRFQQFLTEVSKRLYVCRP
ncbi:unnamed protein product [Lampetra planeri]